VSNVAASCTHWISKYTEDYCTVEGKLCDTVSHF